jgi:hypothetical protein|tara:strand:+ start:1610 stop:2878 length:1269 start_codon:yes stop_codon:yes gene_type:complete
MDIVACLLVIIGLLSTSVFAATQPDTDQGSDYQVGFAALDITPPLAMLAEGETYMGGYGLWTTRGVATSVHDPLTANTVCIRQADQDLCIVIVDSLGLTGPIISLISKQVTRETGLDADRVFVGATHTHAAPDLMGLWGGAPVEYRDLLVERTAESVILAYRSLESADLFYALSKGVAHNRRGWGFTDNEIVTIQAVAKESGDSLGTLVNFASHPVISPMQSLAISSDYVSYLRARVANRTGSPVVFINGAIGDVVPVDKRSGDTWSQAREYGENIADSAVKSLRDKVRISGGIGSARNVIELEVDNKVLAFAQWLGLIDDYASGTFWDLTIKTSVARFNLGREVEAVAVPGEASTRLGLAIKNELKAPVKLFLGLSGGSLGYFIPADEWESGRNGNYEESVSLGKETSGRIESALKEMKVN